MTYLTMNNLSELMECLRPENSEPEEVDEHSPESVFEFDDESIHNYYKLRNDAEAL